MQHRFNQGQTIGWGESHWASASMEMVFFDEAYVGATGALPCYLVKLEATDSQTKRVA